MYKRPSKADTEEDLLQMQKEFLDAEAKPAASLLRKPEKRRSGGDAGKQGEQKDAARDVVSMDVLPKEFAHTTTAPPQKKSRFKQRQEKQEKGPAMDRGDVRDAEDIIDAQDTHITKVLSEIVERDVSGTTISLPSMPAVGGFPTVPNIPRVKHSSEGAGKKKRSIFAETFARSKLEDYGIEQRLPETLINIPATNMSSNNKTADCLPALKSRIVTGDGLSESTDEAVRIHDENQAKMAAMSPQEILEEQAKLLQSLDPSLVAFLRSKRSASRTQPPDKEASSNETEQMDTTPAQIPDNTTINEKTDLPVRPDKKWINMQKVEFDKLEWTKGVAPPTTGDTKTGQPARFDFAGHLVALDADIPAHVGLHHHGNEPERAGYTLDELFQLARSANMQQRAMSLNTLAKIIHNAKHGKFHDCTSKSLVPAMIGGGLVFLIRWALDDSTDSTMMAAVGCLHSLLVLAEDEAALDVVFSWHHGWEVPSMTVGNVETLQDQDQEEQEEEEGDENKAQKTDKDVLQQDIVQGLLRMQILDRLRYILLSWKPSAPVVIQILEILIRIARHSTQASYMIYQCSSLVPCITTNFLPTTWRHFDTSKPLDNVYGYPVPAALKLIRVLASSGSNLAATLASNECITNSLMRYMASGPSDINLQHLEANQLNLETLRTWNVFASYGFEDNLFLKAYPLFMDRLRKLSNISTETGHQAVLQSEVLLRLLQSQIHIAGSAPLIHSHNRDVLKKNSAGTSLMCSPYIKWQHVSGLMQPVELYLTAALQEFRETYHIQRHNVGLLAVALETLSSYYSCIDKQPGYDAVETMQKIEDLCVNQLQPMLECLPFKKLLIELREISLILYEDQFERLESPGSLPDVGSLVGARAVPCPLLQPHKPVSLLLSTLCLLNTVCKLHKGIHQKVLPKLLNDPDLLTYCRRLCQVKQVSHAGRHFVTFENWIQYYICKLSTLVTNTDSKMYHQMSLLLLTRLHGGLEHLVHDILSTVLFTPEIIRDLESSDQEQSNSLESLKLSENVTLSSATREKVKVSKSQLLTDVRANLGGIRATYLSCLARMGQHASRSRARIQHIPCQTESLFSGNINELLVPVDWVYLPLVELYSKAISGCGQSEESVPSTLIVSVSHTVQWVYFLECWRPGILESVSPATKISRLMCAFLAGSDVFLDRHVHCYLSGLLVEYSKPSVLDKIDFTKPIPGLASFFDLYKQFLLQYEAVSFGDSLFASFLLLPLQQQHDIRLRKAVWGEHVSVLRSLFIPLNEVLFPIEKYLEPEETDTELIELYLKALISQTVQPRWSPVMYMLAVHHVNRFMYLQDGKHKKLKKTVLDQVLNVKQQDLRKHLLFYKQANIDGDCGLELYVNLPRSRQKTTDDS